MNCRESSESQNSQQKAENVFREEQQISQAFNVKNFYQRRQFNLQELKLRLNIHKKTHRQSPFKLEHGLNYLQELETKKEQKSKVDNRVRKRMETQSNQRKYVSLVKKGNNRPQTQRNVEQRSSNLVVFSFQKHQKIGDLRGSSTARKNQNYRVQSHRYAQPRKIRIKTLTDNDDSLRSDEMKLQNEEKKTNQSIKVSNEKQLRVWQKKLQYLWDHYQLLTEILITMKQNLLKQKSKIVKYRGEVCQNKFEFLKDMLFSQEISIKTNTFLMKRMNKVIVQSRILQNFGIISLAMFIVLKLKVNSHLINCIGYASANIAFLIKFTILLHQIHPSLSISDSTLDIIDSIQEYQKKTFGGKINNVNQIILKIQQNNQIVHMIHNKVGSMINHQFSEITSSLIKNVDCNCKSLFEYSQYIFEFLSFHLSSLNIRGQFQGIQMPICPYFSHFNKKKTLIIQPWGVIFAKKGNTTFQRAYSDIFLKQVSKHWNIVYWSDLMPKDIDDLLQKLPEGKNLYRYHCFWDNGTFVKCLDLIGCNVHNTMIIDRAPQHYSQNAQYGVSLPWKAQPKDNKLLKVIDVLHHYLTNQQMSMETCVGLIKHELSGKISQSFKQKIKNNKKIMQSL